MPSRPKNVSRLRKKVSNLAQTRVSPRLYGGDDTKPEHPKISDPLEGLDAVKQMSSLDAPRLKDGPKVLEDEWRDRKTGKYRKGGNNPTGFKKGNTLGAAGRPKGRSMTSMMRKVLEDGVDRGDGEMVDFMQILIERGVAEASKGKFQYWKEIFDRMDGKVAQRHEVALAIKAIDSETWDNI